MQPQIITSLDTRWVTRQNTTSVIRFMRNLNNQSKNSQNGRRRWQKVDKFVWCAATRAQDGIIMCLLVRVARVSFDDQSPKDLNTNANLVEIVVLIKCQGRGVKLAGWENVITKEWGRKVWKTVQKSRKPNQFYRMLLINSKLLGVRRCKFNPSVKSKSSSWNENILELSVYLLLFCFERLCINKLIIWRIDKI